MANDFYNLPQELQIHILSYLDAVSLVRCAMTCKSIYDPVKSSSLLVYTIQLHLDGLYGAATSIGYRDLIEILVRRRMAWRSLQKREPLTRQTQHECQAYELSGGVFAQTSNHYLEVLWLPTESNSERRILQLPLSKISVRDLAMDPTQDLIVLLEDNTNLASMTSRTIHIYIHTLSTNVTHPLAHQSPLQVTIFSDDFSGNTVHKPILHIAQNTLALSFYTVYQEARVLIWDWTTSDLVLDTLISSNHSLRPLSYDFGLLDSTYHFITCHANYGSIWLYKRVRSDTVATRAIHLATFHLPPTSPGTRISNTSSHAGPIEANPLLHASNENDRIHMFTVTYTYHVIGNDRDPFQNPSCVNLFVHQRVFSKYAHRACAEGPPLDVPWEEWGPPNTRFIYPSYRQYASHWIRYVYGQRAVFPERIMCEGGRMELTRTVEVLDFSHAAVISAKSVPEMPPSSSKGKWGTLLPPSTIRTKDVPYFVDNVVTHLPCVMSTLDLKQTYAAYMIYADGIVGINKTEYGNILLDVYTI